MEEVARSSVHPRKGKAKYFLGRYYESLRLIDKARV